MKNLSRSLLLFGGLFAATIVFGGVPPLTVTVSNAGGKANFKGMTDAKGTFATGTLQPGNYVVQLSSNSGAVKGKYYTLAVSAGKKKVSAGAVPGEKLAGGGVAMKVDVGAGLNITGQVEEAKNVSKNGKKMVWIPPVTGSHFPGHWVEEGSPEAIESEKRGIIDSKAVQDISNRESR
jgi:hypothetical protein